jgi:hypothetical protein
MANELLTLVQDVAALAPDTPEPVIERALLQAAAQFCRRSQVWREVVDTDRPQAGRSTLGISGPKDTKVVSLISCLVGERSMRLRGDDIYAGGLSGPPRGVALFLGELQFDGKFSGGENIVALAALEPTSISASMPASVVDDWRDQIVSGAAAQLLRAVSGETFNERTALLHKNLFEEGVVQARSRARSGHTHAARTVRYGGI